MRSGDRGTRGDLCGVLNTKSAGFFGVTGNFCGLFSRTSETSASFGGTVLFSSGDFFNGVISTLSTTFSVFSSGSATARARFLKGRARLDFRVERAVFWTDFRGEVERIGIDILLRSGMVVSGLVGGTVLGSDFLLVFSFSLSAHCKKEKL